MREFTAAQIPLCPNLQQGQVRAAALGGVAGVGAMRGWGGDSIGGGGGGWWPRTREHISPRVPLFLAPKLRANQVGGKFITRALSSQQGNADATLFHKATVRSTTKPPTPESQKNPNPEPRGRRAHSLGYTEYTVGFRTIFTDFDGVTFLILAGRVAG